MRPIEPVTIRANGRDYTGWKDGVTVTASIESAARTFDFISTERYPEIHPWQLRPDDAVEILFGSDVVCTGYVDRIQLDDSTTAISGRSKTADLVDCSAAIGNIRGLTLGALANKLAEPYGVAVEEIGITSKVVSRHRTQPGQTVYQAIERYARQQALLLTDNARGDLVLTRAGSLRATTAIERPGNVLPGSSVSFDGSGRFSLYECRGQQAGDDDTNGEDVSTRGSASDDGLTRYRYLLLTDKVRGGAAGRKDRAVWEAATRAGRSVEAVYTLVGWRQEIGDLWAPNQIVTVTDKARGFENQDLLIVSVTYNLNRDSGTTSELTLRPIAGYELLEPRKALKGKGSASGRWKELDTVKIPPRKGAAQ